MNIERETPELEAISEVFRDLGLQDAETHDHFRQLAKQTEHHTWRKSRYQDHETRNNTAKEEKG